MHPILFHLPGNIPVYAYGTMLALSFVVGWFLTLRLGARDGLRRDDMVACFYVTAAAALLGARVLFLVANPERFHGPLDVVRLGGGGIVAYGGFLGGFLGSLVYCRVRKMPLLVWADAAVPSLATGLLLTRIGCLLAGCDFGQPWDGTLAVRFPAGSQAFLQHEAAGLLPPGAERSLPVHPTQLYESASGLALLVLLMWVRSQHLRPGWVLVAFTAVYGGLRFIIEQVRADTARGALGPLSTSQVVALGTAVLAVALAFYLSRPRAIESGG